MKLNKFAMAFAASSALFMVGCSDSGGGSSSNDDGPQAAVNCPSSAGGLNVSEAEQQVDGKLACVLTGTMTSDFTMTADTVWILDNFVRVGNGNDILDTAQEVQDAKDNGATLTVEAGTDVRGTDDASLLVTRGSKLMAEGTASDPITFSSLDDNFDGEAEWGGIVVQGFAKHAGAGDTVFCDNGGAFCNVAGEGGSQIGNFGGSDDADNSGVIKYVRIAEGGLVAGPNNEINGLTLQGVGHGTTVEYVQVHNNRDDGVEWFGGAVNAKYLVLTNNDDDDIDFDEGYRGNIQYALIQKNPTKTAPTGSNDPRGVEANSSGADSVQLTEATIANMTIIGSPLVQAGNSQPGMRLRGDVTVTVVNSAVSAYGECYELDQGANNLTDITLTNFLGACGATYSDVEAGLTYAETGEVNTTNTSLSINADAVVTNVEASLPSATSITATNNGSGFTFDSTDYIGAVEAGNNWWSDWVIPGSVQP